jgi:hypothetical protein
LRSREQQSTRDAVADDTGMGAVEENPKEATEDYTTNGAGMTKKERNRKRAWKAKQSAARNPAAQDQTPSNSAATCEFTELNIAQGLRRTNHALAQEEGLQNIMMSWYYAGYHTGVYCGQTDTTQDHTQVPSTLSAGGKLNI